MVDLKVPMKSLRALMWKANVVQEDNCKSNGQNANTDQTTLKTHGNPIARLCEAAIRGSKEVPLAVIKGQFWNESCQ